jgi:hypothetical protein
MPRPDALERAIDDAADHGQAGDPDHEVGDLQQLARQLWALLTPAQRRAFAGAWRPWSAES